MNRERGVLREIAQNEATPKYRRSKTEAPLIQYRLLLRTAADYYCHQTSIGLLSSQI
jgi:hypothetical protein